MWCIVINFKDCTLTFNTGFHTQAIDDQVSLNRKLTFGHLNAYLEYIQLSYLSIMKTASFTVDWRLLWRVLGLFGPRSSGSHYE
jgi:hypothetical protein